MAELVDAGDLKSPGVKPVPVRFRLAAPEKPRISHEIRGFSCQFDLIFVKYRLIQCAVLMRHDRGADSVAGDINGSTRHIEDTVDTHDQADAGNRQTDRIEYHCQQPTARLRYRWRRALRLQ